jgi:hypothetical protein
MTKLQWSVLVVSTVAMPAGMALSEVGCSSSSNGAAPAIDSGSPDTAVEDTGSDDVATKADGAGAAAPSGVTLTWKVQSATVAAGVGDASTGAAATPLAGVKVCAYPMASIPCVTTDATGVFVLPGLPAATPVAITLDKDGYRSLLAPVLMATSHDETAEPISMTKTTDPDPPIGKAIDWTGKGQVEFFVLGQGAFLVDAGPEGDPGAMVTLAPMSGDGPFFITDQNTFDASAKTLIDALGAAYNLPAGSYSLTFADATHDCEPLVAGFGGWGYPGAAHEVTFPIVAGYTTIVGEYCPPVTTSPTDSGASDAGNKDAGDAH